jgi:cell wall-associated NlpC family hydrolase
MTVTRTQIVKTAQSLVGTPWKHQGRSRRGVDCVGLIYLIAKELDILPDRLDIPAYRREPDGSVRGYFDAHMHLRSPDDLKPGMVLLHSFNGSPFHASVVINAKAGAIIHGTAARRAVVVDLFKGQKDGMRLHAAYDFKGVADG